LIITDNGSFHPFPPFCCAASSDWWSGDLWKEQLSTLHCGESRDSQR